MKRVTIINGAADESYADFEQALNKYLGAHRGTINSEVYHVRDLQINFCMGCWDCWVKTPGLCRHKDDMPLLLKSMINSDLCVFVSPIHMGFVSSLMKKVNEKVIPLVHPYIGISAGEFHHMKRYKNYPKLGLVLLDKGGQSQESYDIITQIYKRLALNFKTELSFSLVSSGTTEEVEHALNSI